MVSMNPCTPVPDAWGMIMRTGVWVGDVFHPFRFHAMPFEVACRGQGKVSI